MPADVDVVVFDEDELIEELVCRASIGNLLENLLAGLIARVRLAGEDKLDRAAGIVHHGCQFSRCRQQ